MPPNNDIPPSFFDESQFCLSMCRSSEKTHEQPSRTQTEKYPKSDGDNDVHHLSPVTVTNYLDVSSSASYADGTYDVQRSARRRRIKCGSLGSGSDESISFDISYRIFRPELLTAARHDRDAPPPLVVLHGGPSQSSTYLYPLVEQIKDRSIIFYDQLGCGRSDDPKDINFYSISNSVDDFEALLKALRIRNFVLYGHSFGGIIAYEYVRRNAERSQYDRERLAAEDDVEHICQSIILSNVTTSTEKSNQESSSLVDVIKKPFETQDAANINDAFWRRHQCRLEQTPAVLQHAIDNMGVEWFDTETNAYTAKSLSRWARPLPTALIIRGTHDFVTKTCTDGWLRLFKGSKIIEAEIDGSHYPHLEQPDEYGDIIRKFLRDQSNDSPS